MRCEPTTASRSRSTASRSSPIAFGTGDETVFCLNGGPGLPCDYLREAHSCLVDQGYRVVAFDQLGTGASDRPTDPALWTIGRYVEETETVRKALGLGKVHMLGHSWGGWLGIDYALTYPENLQDADPRGHRRRHAASHRRNWSGCAPRSGRRPWR